MPAKKTKLSDEERRKRLREAARDLGTSDDPKDFERALKEVVPSRKSSKDAQ
jgi:hypothetical protein